MSLTYNQLNDLVTATLFRDEKKKATNIDSALLRRYPAARQLLHKNQVVEHGGKKIRFNASTGGGAAVEAFGAFHVAEYQVGDHLIQGEMEMKGIRSHFAYDILEEEFNSGEWEIISHIKNREQESKIELTKGLESRFWTFADTSAPLEPQGILYYLPYVATAGFTGTVSGSHTTVSNINPSTYTGWKSYGDIYAAVSQDDLFDKMRDGWENTRFEAPLDAMAVKDYSTGYQYGIYGPYDVTKEAEHQLRLQNDSLGNDVDTFAGKAMFRNTPFTTVPALESNARLPVFGINWGVLKNYIKRGWWMKLMRVNSANQPLVVGVNNFCVYQLVCFNRRELGFNIALAA